MDYINQEKESIIEELLNSGKVKSGQSISYEYFKELYEQYKEKMAEVDFATILGITYSNYINMKNGGTRAKVLKDRKEELDEEKKKEIIEELLNGGKIKPGQSIDYEYFKELYESYKEKMTEVEFASLLGINYGNYTNIKGKRRRTKVLEDRKERLSERDKKEIVEDLLENGKVTPEQSIDYKYFKVLYEPYKDKMKETEFASLLGINYISYMSMKNNGQRVKLLKPIIAKKSEKEKEEIIAELLNSEKIKPGKSINYEDFKVLYEPYKEEMSEIDFASLLGINYGNYMNIKNNGQRGNVLKDRIEKTGEKEKNEIIEELLNSGKVKPGQFINYQYFKELYEPHREKMAEKEFASLLGISYSNYRNLKNKGTRAKVLKNRIEKTNEKEKNEIIEELLNSGKVRIGQLIEYQYFKELYEPYREKMAEVEFANLIGIKYSNHRNLKNLRTQSNGNTL